MQFLELSCQFNRLDLHSAGDGLVMQGRRGFYLSRAPFSKVNPVHQILQKGNMEGKVSNGEYAVNT